MDVTVCILIGLPAVGKSMLAQKLKTSMNSINIHTCVIEYDRLISDYLPLSLNKWKEKRREIVSNVESYIEYLHETSADQFIMNSSVDLCSCFQSSRCRRKKHMFLIDDNMFYRSMRYPYYQLARKYASSYCQIYFKGVSTDQLVERNSCRKSMVTKKTILKMADSLEVPNPLKYSWENQTLVIEDQSDIDGVLQFIVNAAKIKCAPVDPFHFVRQEDQKKCFESFLHQVDQVIRKYISKQIVQMKSEKMTKEQIVFNSKSFNEGRKNFFCELKKKNFSMNDELEMIITEFNSMINSTCSEPLLKDLWIGDVENCFKKYLADYVVINV